MSEPGGQELRRVELSASMSGPAAAPVLVLGNSLGTTRELWEPQLDALGRRTTGVWSLAPYAAAIGASLLAAPDVVPFDAGRVETLLLIFAAAAYAIATLEGVIWAMAVPVAYIALAVAVQPAFRPAAGMTPASFSSASSARRRKVVILPPNTLMSAGAPPPPWRVST